MTDAPVATEQPAAPAAPAAAPAAPASNPTHANTPEKPAAQPAQGEKPAGEKPPEASTYKVPEAYKDKPWAAKIKSEDDLYKQIDNLSSVVGKKGVTVPDFKTAAPEQIEEYLSTTRPADKGVYKFQENSNPKVTDAVAELMHKNGVTEYQGNKIIEGYQALQKNIVEEATSADGYKGVMAKSFGEKYEDAVKPIIAEHSKHMTPEDKQMMEHMPNEYLGMVYRLTHAMQKAYGAKENPSAHTGEQGSPVGQDLGKIRQGYRDEIAALNSRPHSQAEKDVLINKLQDTYKQQTNLRK